MSRAFDVVVVGAGVAGSAATRAFARAFAGRGRSVALVDAHPPAQVGARWVNSVPLWMFDAADVPRPLAPELRRGGPFVMLDADGRPGVRVDPCPHVPVDMRLLGERLRADAEADGADFLYATRVTGLELDGGRPRALLVEGPDGPGRVEASLFVDAAGMKGILRRRVPALAEACPTVIRDDICSATQLVMHLDDPRGAERWLSLRGARPLEILSRAGVAGGYSISNVQVDLEDGEVDLLTGAIARPDLPSGPDLMARSRAELPWLGEVAFGGSGAIPIRRPYPRLAAPGLALLGDSGCQVFPAHGSGIGVGLVAAKMLADACAHAADPGGLAATWAYTRRFQQEHGGLLAAYDLFRRLSQGLTPDETRALVGSGLMTVNGTHAALEQRLPKVSPLDLPRLARGVGKTPRLGARLIATLAWMPVIARHARRFPAAPDALAPWARRMDALFTRATGRA